MSFCTKALPPTTTSAPRFEAAERRHEALEILGAPQVEPGPDAGDRPGARACRRARERPGDLERHVGVGDRRDGGGRHQVDGRPRARRRSSSPASAWSAACGCPPAARACRPDRRGTRSSSVATRANRRSPTASRDRPRGSRSATSRARSRVGSAMHRPARDAAAERAIDALVPAPRLLHLRPGRTQVLEVASRTGRLAMYRHAPTPAPTTATSSGQHDRGPPARHQPRQTAAEPRRRAPDLPAPAPPAPPARRAAPGRWPSSRTGSRRRRSARSAGSRESRSPAATRTRPTRSAPRPASRPGCPGPPRPAPTTGSSVAAALLEVAREQDDPEVDAVADDDRRQERRREVQVADTEAGERERHQRAQRERAEQRADGRARRERTAASRSRRSRP